MENVMSVKNVWGDYVERANLESPVYMIELEGRDNPQAYKE